VRSRTGGNQKFQEKLSENRGAGLHHQLEMQVAVELWRCPKMKEWKGGGLEFLNQRRRGGARGG
jgi:hypothetical protein